MTEPAMEMDNNEGRIFIFGSDSKLMQTILTRLHILYMNSTWRKFILNILLTGSLKQV